MVKLGFRLPNRLIAPVTFFAACNYFAKEINVGKEDFTFYFDPRNNGLINKKVALLLNNIEHPVYEDSGSAYSITLDQNIINAFIIQTGTVKKDLSLRKLIKTLD